VTASSHAAIRGIRIKIGAVTAAAAAVVVTLVTSPLAFTGLVPLLNLAATPLVAAMVSGLCAVAGLAAGVLVTSSPADGRRAVESSDGSLSDLAWAEVTGYLEHLGTAGGTTGFLDSWREACLVLSHAPRSTGGLFLSLGSLLVATPILTPFMPAPLAAFAGLGTAFVAMGIAILTRVAVADEPAAIREEPEAPAPRSEATGAELLERIQQASTYRGRLLFCSELEASHPVFADSGTASDPFLQLIDRFPLLGAAWLHRIGLRAGLTASQGRALEHFLADEASGDGRDVLFVGPPGSGRGTLANLLALCYALHRDGAVVFVHAESPDRTVRTNAIGESVGERGTSSQYLRWVENDALLRQSTLVAFSDRNDHIPLGCDADVIFTDPRILSEQLLPSTSRPHLGLAQRLRLVVIDHPERLSPPELLRLRTTIARIRLVSERLTRQVQFMVLLSPLDNDQALGKWLLNHGNVTAHLFDPWHERTTLAGWKSTSPGRGESTPIVLSPVVPEVANLLVTAVAEADALHDSARGRLQIGVVDAAPLLGAETRDAIFQMCIQTLRRSEERQELNVAITFIATPDVAVDRDRAFDLLVVLGVEANPSRLVMSLRPALRRAGVLLLVSDGENSAPAFREMAESTWRPGIPHVLRTSALDPALLLPEQPDAVATSELARLVADFGSAGLPRRRAEEIFPSARTSRLIAEWAATGHLVLFESFAADPGGRSVQARTQLAAVPQRFQAGIYEVPWGCSTREVLELHDQSSRAPMHLGQGDNSAVVDWERIFLDLFPGAVLPLPHSTLEVVELDAPPEARDGSEPMRYRVRGRLLVRQRHRSDAVTLPRRQPRFDVRLVRDGVSDSVSAEPRQVPSDDRPAAGEAPRWATCLARGSEADLTLENMLGRVRELPSVPGAPRAAIAIWQIEVDEQLRDVLTALERPEAPATTVQVDVPPPRVLEHLRRRYRAIASSLFLDDSSGRVEHPSSMAAALPGVRGFARLLRAYLAERFLNFGREYALDVFSTEDFGSPDQPRPDGAGTVWRIVTRRRRSIGDAMTLDPIYECLEREWSSRILPWIGARLDGCLCAEGCGACCGGLDSPPIGDLPSLDPTRWRPSDAISKAATRELVGRLLGRPATP
jgi:hypothetical protein